MTPLIEITEATFDEVLFSNKDAILVIFTASWCQACQVTKKNAMEYTTHKKDKRVATVDVDECPDITDRYGITELPTLMMFVNGNDVMVTTGNVSTDDIEALFNSTKTLI